jgi:sigma-B regulation protein RsbU (phosphoserine phosphatase)
MIEQLNRVVSRLAPEDKFISSIFCKLAPDGTLSYVNAGHCPLIVCSGGEVHNLVTGGMALGMFESARYEEHSLRLADGDLAVMYTDGILEAVNEEHELFGEDRLLDTVRGLASRPPAEVAKGILSAVDAFRGGEPVNDDLTLMVVGYRG